MVLKRKSTLKNAQKSLFRASAPMKMEIYDDITIYENQNIAEYVFAYLEKLMIICNIYVLQRNMSFV